MPKVKQSNISNKLNFYVKQYPEFITDGKILFCNACNKMVSSEKLYTVKQHLQSAKHIELSERCLTKKSLQMLIGEHSLPSIVKFLWLSIDETTDATDRHVGYELGILDTDQNISKQTFLLNTSLLNSINHSSIAKLFDETIQILGKILIKISFCSLYRMLRHI